MEGSPEGDKIRSVKGCKKMAAKKTAKPEKDTQATNIQAEKLKALEHALADLDKQFGKGAVMKMGADAVGRDIPVISTGCLTLDYALGVGGKADFTLGASISPTLSSPVEVKDCVVKSLHRGDFVLEGPASRGARGNMGPAAVLMAGQLMILVCHDCNNCKDPQFYRSVGIEPTLCRLVSVKACTSFRAAYEPFSAQICNTITPGAAGVQLTMLPFARIPAPFYPFQETTQDMIPAAVCLR